MVSSSLILQESHKSFRTQLNERYRGISGLGWFDRLFVKLRLKILPLEALDKYLPQNTNILEIGCGHGLISNYLALSSRQRLVIGVDMDTKRIEIAQKASIGLENVNYINTKIEEANLSPVDVVIFFGVLCLIPKTSWDVLFSSVKQILRPCGLIILHDIRKSNHWTYRLHVLKEKIFKLLGITKGEGLFVADIHNLDEMMNKKGLKFVESLPQMDVPFHSCFTHVYKQTEI